MKLIYFCLYYHFDELFYFILIFWVLYVKGESHMLIKLTRREGRVGQMLTLADKGGREGIWRMLTFADKEARGVLTPSDWADIICEQPLSSRASSASLIAPTSFSRIITCLKYESAYARKKYLRRSKFHV